MKRGNWTVSAIDAGRTALVLGPFRSENDCRQWAYRDPEDGGDIRKCNSCSWPAMPTGAIGGLLLGWILWGTL